MKVLVLKMVDFRQKTHAFQCHFLAGMRGANRSPKATVVIQKKKLRIILLDSPLLWFFLFRELAFRVGPRDLGCFWMVTVPRIWIDISTP